MFGATRSFYWRGHGAFAVLLIGAGALFIAGVWLALLLPKMHFGQFALLNVAIFVFATAGWLGLDQTLMRVGVIGADRALRFPLSLVALAIPVVCGTIAVTVMYLAENSVVYGEEWSIWPILIGLAASSAHGNLLRLRGEFVRSQIVLNMWRFGALAAAAFAAITEDSNRRYSVVLLVLALGGVASVAMLIRHLQKMPVRLEPAMPGATYWFLPAFALSIGLSAIVGSLDRLLIQDLLGVAALAEYFFAANFIVLPFSVLANYVGFRKLVAYKNGFCLDVFHRESAFVAIGTGLLFLVLTAVYLAMRHWFDAVGQDSISGATLFWCGVMAILRVGYGQISAALGAFVSSKVLSIGNAVCSIGLLLVVSVAYIGVPDLDVLLRLVVVAWLLRYGIGYRAILMSRAAPASGTNRQP